MLTYINVWKTTSPEEFEKHFEFFQILCLIRAHHSNSHLLTQSTLLPFCHSLSPSDCDRSIKTIHERRHIVTTHKKGEWESNYRAGEVFWDSLYFIPGNSTREELQQVSIAMIKLIQEKNGFSVVIRISNLSFRLAFFAFYALPE
ncbi:CLUMA_CG011433, isoform A [Clunio marinus]|uniref:CLUMA_CG011433, isoform A n=1 Tax=Clunio marinus TaxID=568069 RepID=A0A1J1ICV1_9DIPT|nr:CLUMA_CG011433, isoform A [Clunio marinus]